MHKGGLSNLAFAIGGIVKQSTLKWHWLVLADYFTGLRALTLAARTWMIHRLLMVTQVLLNYLWVELELIILLLCYETNTREVGIVTRLLLERYISYRGFTIVAKCLTDARLVLLNIDDGGGCVWLLIHEISLIVKLMTLGCGLCIYSRGDNRLVLRNYHIVVAVDDLGVLSRTRWIKTTWLLYLTWLLLLCHLAPRVNNLIRHKFSLRITCVALPLTIGPSLLRTLAKFIHSEHLPLIQTWHFGLYGKLSIWMCRLTLLIGIFHKN